MLPMQEKGPPEGRQIPSFDISGVGRSPGDKSAVGVGRRRKNSPRRMRESRREDEQRRENIESFSTQALRWDYAPRREILLVACGAEQVESGGRASDKSAGRDDRKWISYRNRGWV